MFTYMSSRFSSIFFSHNFSIYFSVSGHDHSALQSHVAQDMGPLPRPSSSVRAWGRGIFGVTLGILWEYYGNIRTQLMGIFWMDPGIFLPTFHFSQDISSRKCPGKCWSHCPRFTPLGCSLWCHPRPALWTPIPESSSESPSGLCRWRDRKIR